MARPRVRWWKAWPSWKVSRWGPHLVVLRTRRPKALLDGLWHWFPRFWYAASTKANSFLPFGMIQMIHAVLYALHRLWQRTCVGSTVVMKAVNTNQEKAACGYKMLWIFDNICIYLKLFLCRWCFYVFSWTFTSVDCDKQWSQLHFLSRPLGRSQRNEFIQHLSLWLQLRVVIQVLLYKLPEGCTFTLGYPSRLMCRSLQPLLALETARPCGWQFLWPHEGNAIWRCSMSQLHGLRQLHTSTPMTFSSLKPTSEGQYWCYLAFLRLQVLLFSCS